MDLNLKGKRAVVCGSTQGIGKAAAIELALLGAHVTLLAREEGKLKEVAKELSTHAGQSHDYLAADFNFPDLVKQAIERNLPKGEVHILINNSVGQPAGQGIDAKPEDFIKPFSGHWVCSKLLW